MHPNVPCSTLFNSQDMEIAYMSIYQGKDESHVVQIYNGILLNHKNNETMPSAATWEDLNIVILSEVRQRKTNVL